MQNRRKRQIYILLTISTVLVVFFGFKNYKFSNYDNTIYRLQCSIFNANTVTVKTKKLDINKVVIKSIEDNKIVFEGGKETSKIKNQYGGDNFEIYYENKLIGQAGIYKTNWWYTHDYYFDLVKTGSRILFRFQAIGPNSNLLYFKFYEKDLINNKSTETFYNSKGKTGQVNIENFNKAGTIVADEIWIEGVLTTLNTYSNGKLDKNYSTTDRTKGTKYKLSRLNKSDSLVYVYQTITNNNTKNELIKIKNYR